MKLNFNRPVLYVSLLSEQASGITRNHSVYASTAIDEFTLRTPDALMNGIAMELYLKNCCPNLDNPNSILLCDLQHLLASIKIASQGPELEVLLRCPNCNTIDPYIINLQQVLPSLSANKWFSSITIDDFHFSFRSPTYKEFTYFAIEDFKISKQLFQISKLDSPENYSAMTASLLEKKRKFQLEYQSLCINSISNGENITTSNREFIMEWFNQCEISIQKQIVDYITSAIKESSIADFSVSCSECKNNFSAPLDLDM